MMFSEQKHFGSEISAGPPKTPLKIVKFRNSLLFLFYQKGTKVLKKGYKILAQKILQTVL